MIRLKALQRLLMSAAVTAVLLGLPPLGQTSFGHSGHPFDLAGSTARDRSLPADLGITAAPACATMVKLRAILFVRTLEWELLSMSPGLCQPVESVRIPTVRETRLVDVSGSPSFWTSSRKTDLRLKNDSSRE